MGFSENLKRCRKEKGFSQADLAGSLGVGQSCIANWESGTREPRIRDIGRLAEVLGVSSGRLAGYRIPSGVQLYGNDTVPGEKIPLFTSRISAGFPSPADDYVEKRLDLNDLLVKNTAATFFVKVSGESMLDAGIHDGDVLVVDRSISPGNNKIVIAVLNGELTVKRIHKNGKKLFLVPENSEYSSIEVTEDAEFVVWGVVTNVIHPV